MFLFVGYIFGGGLTGVEEMESFVLWTTCIIVGFFYGWYLWNSLKGKNRETKCEVKKDGLDCKK